MDKLLSAVLQAVEVELQTRGLVMYLVDERDELLVHDLDRVEGRGMGWMFG